MNRLPEFLTRHDGSGENEQDDPHETDRPPPDAEAGRAATALPLVHIRTAGAAGKLNIGITDHWVKAGDTKVSQLIATWSEQNKVDVQIAFLTSTNLEVLAADSVAHTGHDMLSYSTWYGAAIRRSA